nr:hypothetical protein [Mycoplasmopsis bovis]
MVLQINGKIFKRKCWYTDKINWQFSRILDSFKHKISIIKLDEQIKYDNNKEYINK